MATVLTPNGSLLVAGSDKSTSGPFVIRLNSDGSLDREYGSGGSAQVGPLAGATLTSAGSSGDGSITVSLERTAPGDQSEALIAKFTSGGELDSSFGSEGVVSLGTQAQRSGIRLLVDPRGRVIVLERDELARLNADGSLDLTFAADPTITDLLGELRLVGFGPADTLILGGELGSGLAGLLRLTATGSIDATFADNGRFEFDVSGVVPSPRSTLERAVIKGDGSVGAFFQGCPTLGKSPCTYYEEGVDPAGNSTGRRGASYMFQTAVTAVGQDVFAAPHSAPLDELPEGVGFGPLGSVDAVAYARPIDTLPIDLDMTTTGSAVVTGWEQQFRRRVAGPYGLPVATRTALFMFRPASSTTRDRDLDGLKNKRDSCPYLPGPRTQQGCPTVRRTIGGKTEDDVLTGLLIAGSPGCRDDAPIVLIRRMPGPDQVADRTVTDNNGTDVSSWLFVKRELPRGRYVAKARAFRGPHGSGLCESDITKKFQLP